MRTKAGVQGEGSAHGLPERWGVSERYVDPTPRSGRTLSPSPRTSDVRRRPGSVSFDAVLDAEDVGERRCEPQLGECSGKAEVVRRVGEREVVGSAARKRGDEAQCVGAMDHRRGSRAEQLRRSRASRRGSCGDCSTKSTTSAPRESASSPSAPEPGEQVEHARAREPRIARCSSTLRAHDRPSAERVVLGRVDPTAAPLSRRRSASSGTPEVGQASLQPRLTVPLVALETIGDVDRRADVELAMRAEPFPTPTPRARGRCRGARS